MNKESDFQEFQDILGTEYDEEYDKLKYFQEQLSSQTEDTKIEIFRIDECKPGEPYVFEDAVIV